MKIKVVVIISIIVVLSILTYIGATIYLGKKQDQTFNNYVALLNEHKYEEAYEMLSNEAKSKINKEDYVARNKNIYTGIDAVQLKTQIKEKQKKDKKIEISYHQEMETSAGKIEFDNTVNLQREKLDYKIDWTSNLIFPELNDNYKVRVATIPSLRGNILDRNSNKLTTVEAESGKREYVYPEAFSHLLGYVSSINEEELEQNAGKGYSQDSKIGKTGIEYAYEETLRGIDGKEIYIEDENGNKVKQLAVQQEKGGQDVKLTIDSELQQKLYEQMKNDKGFFVVMDPQTGEILAAVSTPAYNPNDFVAGISGEKWQELTNDAAKPLYNRFAQSYCPGSTFKPITAAIGLTTGKLTQDTTFDYEGLKWRKQDSWGENYITTLTEYSGPKNIQNALIHSDNIFFARAAMQIGSKDFCEGLDKIGFNEEFQFPLSLKKSVYSTEGQIEDEKMLADSGYGQGHIQVNPIHMASIYSSFANNGSMIKPYIEFKEKATPEILKENVFSQEAASAVKQAMIQVVENPEGTANDMKIPGQKIAGKTGTAELKKSSDDKESGTLGWFDCFTLNEGDQKNMLIISMVENVQDNTSGGSHYLIQKIRTLFQ